MATTYSIPTGKIDHIVMVNGVWMTGDTYDVKDIIKRYFAGKWDSNRRAWQINPEQIKIATAATPQHRNAYNPSNWRNADGSLNEDF